MPWIQIVAVENQTFLLNPVPSSKLTNNIQNYQNAFTHIPIKFHSTTLSIVQQSFDICSDQGTRLINKIFVLIFVAAVLP